MFHFVSAGQSSSAAKLKSLTGALEIMTETCYAFQLIHKELLEEQIEVRFRDAQLCKAFLDHTLTSVFLSRLAL